MDHKPRKMRDTTLAAVDKEAPAYRIIYGVFGGLTPFVEKSKEAHAAGAIAKAVAKSTAHLWITEGLIPSRRQADVVAIAEFHKMPLDRVLFVPEPQAQAAAA